MYNCIVFLFLIIVTIFYIGIMNKKFNESSTYLYYLICISPFIIYYLLILLCLIKNNCKKKNINDIVNSEDNILNNL